MNLAEAKSKIAVDLQALRGRLAVKHEIAKQLELRRIKLAELQAQVSVNEEAKIVIQAIEAKQQIELKHKVEGLISYALQQVFGRPLKFICEFGTHGSQTDVEFKVEDERGVAMSIKDAHGGGLLVISSWLLRLIVMLSSRPALRSLVVSDEPFAQVSEEYRDTLVNFLRALVEKSDLQFLIVTHLPELADIGDKRYRFRLVNGRTTVDAL